VFYDRITKPGLLFPNKNLNFTYMKAKNSRKQHTRLRVTNFCKPRAMVNNKLRGVWRSSNNDMEMKLWKS